MASLESLVRFLDDELRTSELPDWDEALNGLQLANGGTVARIAAAVDFSSATVEAAVRERADLLIVHHGMYWGGVRRLVGPAYDRVRHAISGNLAVYSSHIPLDVHPVLGNNALFARELGLSTDGTFGRYKTIDVGVRGSCDADTGELVKRVGALSARYATTAVGTPHAPGRRTRRWAIITGAGAYSEALVEAAEQGIDTLIVGEGPHHTAVQAMELGIVVIYAGHYASETFGVRALVERVGARFELPYVFVDVPTGL